VADEIITLWRYRDFPEALVARAKLEADGIECFLADENMIRLDWFRSDALGRLRLQLRQENAEAAMEILAQEIPAGFSAEEIGEEYNQPRCPNCGSLDVSFQEYNKLTLLIFWFLALPIPIYKNCWQCEDCQEEWKEKDESLL
jgi:hypothetical protein